MKSHGSGKIKKDYFKITYSVEINRIIQLGEEGGRAK